MATISAFIRTTGRNKKVKIRIRLSDGRDNRYYGISTIEILPEWWDNKKCELKNRILLPVEYSREDINNKIQEARKIVADYYSENKRHLEPDWITNVLSGKVADKIETDNIIIYSFFELLQLYYDKMKASPGRKKHVKVVMDMLARFQAISDNILDIDTFDHVAAFETFLRDEHTFYTNYPDIYPSTVRITARGQNTINSKLKIIRTFFNWARKNKYTRNNPFDAYEFSSDVYGDPIPLLPEEVEFLYNKKDIPQNLKLVRDLFCLHCYCGPRVEDFMGLTKENLIEDILMYIPHKTIVDNPVTVYVPLVKNALAIINRYNYPNGRLMPAMNVNGKDGYNKKVKELCRIAGLTRSVVTINTITRLPEIKQLCDIVTTHTARKTFINSNYLETQDPKLIGKMTGHSPNSRAFDRYRDIDIDLLRKQVKKAFEKK